MPVQRQALFVSSIRETLMKAIFIFSFLFSTFIASAQLSFPKGFYLIKGENLSGQDDVYTNGRYSFQTHDLFRDYEYHGNDEGVKKYASAFFRFPFYITKDSLCWGSGKSRNIYAYVVVTKHGEVIELSSSYNDKGFAEYSKWLLSTIRTYYKKGKLIMFPIRA
jgi:hypothetical protein